MLDRYQIGRDGPTTINVDVTEKRAPTDESVRPLKEMESAAEAKVLEAVRCGDNTFDCTIHVQDDHLSGSRLFAIIFKLNGRKMRAEYRASCEAGVDQIVPGILAAVSDEVARGIAGAFVDLQRRIGLWVGR